MATDAMATQGTTVEIGAGDAASVDAATDTFEAIGEVTNIDGPGGEAPVIDATHLQSTRSEKLMGLPDEGQMTLDVNYVAADAGQTAFKTARDAQQLKNFKVTYPDGSSDDFKGFALGFSKSGSVNDRWTASMTIELTGEITHTAAA